MSDTLKQIKMLNGWIFVQPEAELKEVGGITIPDTARGESQKGTVVCVAEDVEKNIKLADTVVFRRKASFSQIELDDENLLVMKKTQVLGIMFGESAKDVSPLRDNVFLEWEKAANEYGKSGLVRPDSYKGMHYTGIIVAVGPDCKGVKPGDRVFFDRFCGIENFSEDGKRYGFVTEDDIYCNGVPLREEEAAALAVDQ